MSFLPNEGGKEKKNLTFGLPRQALEGLGTLLSEPEKKNLEDSSVPSLITLPTSLDPTRDGIPREEGPLYKVPGRCS